MNRAIEAKRMNRMFEACRLALANLTHVVTCEAGEEVCGTCARLTLEDAVRDAQAVLLARVGRSHDGAPFHARLRLGQQVAMRSYLPRDLDELAGEIE